MGFYNILETFFFISLAITFVLIMMLVYHFKGRISILEQKCDTMFEIMNNMVKEMKNLKYAFGMVLNESQQHSVGPSSEMFQNFPYHINTIPEEEDDDVEDDDVEDVNDYLDKIVVSDNEDNNDDDDDDKSIKIINIDLNDEMNNENEDLGIDTEVIEDMVNGDVEEEFDIEQEQEPETNEMYEIIVNKLDTTNENGEYLAKNEPMDYKKIDVSYLRTLAITRGLVSDTKRLKKNDLVRLLEQSDETE